MYSLYTGLAVYLQTTRCSRATADDIHPAWSYVYIYNILPYFQWSWYRNSCKIYIMSIGTSSEDPSTRPREEHSGQGAHLALNWEGWSKLLFSVVDCVVLPWLLGSWYLILKPKRHILLPWAHWTALKNLAHLDLFWGRKELTVSANWSLQKESDYLRFLLGLLIFFGNSQMWGPSGCYLGDCLALKSMTLEGPNLDVGR